MCGYGAVVIGGSFAYVIEVWVGVWGWAGGCACVYVCDFVGVTLCV